MIVPNDSDILETVLTHCMALSRFPLFLNINVCSMCLPSSSGYLKIPIACTITAFPPKEEEEGTYILCSLMAGRNADR